MEKDDHDLLQLIGKLNLLEERGLGRWVPTPWNPASPFPDSFKSTDEVAAQRSQLDSEGETAQILEKDQHNLELALKEWLRTRINDIEDMRLDT